MAKSSKSKPPKLPVEKVKDEKVYSDYSGNEIVEGDKNDPEAHDGQAWREGRTVGVQPDPSVNQ